MKTAIIQHDIKRDALEENLQKLSFLLNQQTGADLYVLSETFATGFMAERAIEKAEEESHIILKWMQQEARRLNAAIVGSVVCVDNENETQENACRRNRLFFVRPDGSYEYYDKRHLFGYGGEGKEFKAGERRVVTEWRGVRFLLQVCYDLRFPVFSRNHGDYDAIIYVANWPSSRRDAWQTLLKARAIENQCFVVGVNRVGSDKNNDYSGDSVIIDAYGRTFAACKESFEDSAAAELDMNELLCFRKSFPVLEDADK